MENPDPLQLFEIYLRGKGLYNTLSRRHVAQAIFGQQGPFDAASLWALVREAQVGLSTIYRTLDLLDEAGLVRRLPGEITRFECIYRKPWCEYLRCNQCGQWIAFT